jgi:hypothetical protein
MNSIDFAVWQSQATSLEHMIAYDSGDASLVVGGDASRLRIVSASRAFWDVTGAQPLFGALHRCRFARARDHAPRVCGAVTAIRP